MCEHHLLSFFGTSTIGYIARNRIIGVGKMVRIVNHFARHEFFTLLSVRKFMTLSRGIVLVAIVLQGLNFSAHSQVLIREDSEQESFIARRLIDGLSYPWGVAFLKDGKFLITERTGRLLLADQGSVREVKGVPAVSVVGQGGLLDVVLSPDYPRDALVYLSFTEGESGLYGTSVARGQLVGMSTSSPKLKGMEVIYRGYPRSGGGLHFGSRLVFDNEGYLYITLGERGSMKRAQKPRDPYGSVLRINPDGSIPLDNPFAPGMPAEGRGDPAVWSYGHRNAQGIAKDPATGEIWLHEHGPKGGDEVNIVRRGANYGWPMVTYGINYDGTVISPHSRAEGVQDPVVYWVPSIAPSGLAFYSGSVFPRWTGNLFVGALAGKHLRRLVLRGNRIIHQEVLLKNRLGRIRDARSGPDGYIYILTDAKRGALYRLEPNSLF